MCFDRNIDGNKDVKSLDCDYLLLKQSVKLALERRLFRADLSFKFMIRDHPFKTSANFKPLILTPP